MIKFTLYNNINFFIQIDATKKLTKHKDFHVVFIMTYCLGQIFNIFFVFLLYLYLVILYKYKCNLIDHEEVSSRRYVRVIP